MPVRAFQVEDELGGKAIQWVGWALGYRRGA